MKKLLLSLIATLLASPALASPFASAPITNFDPDFSHLECVAFLVADNIYDNVTVEIDNAYGTPIDQRTCNMSPVARLCYAYAYGGGIGVCKVRVNVGAKADLRGSLALVGDNGTGKFQTIATTPVE